MKIAILSDIHGNLPALEAVAQHVAAWNPDHIVVNGDTVNRGPYSLAAWEFVQAQADWRLLKGNHEVYLIDHAKPDAPRDGRLFEINRLSYWTYQQHREEVAKMAALADGLSLFAPDGSEVRIRHASMKSNRDGIWIKSSPEKIRTQIGDPPALFATAHIHWPFIRQIDETLVVNSGSVGTPADGNPQASYAQLVWQDGHWSAEIIRLAYDRECARQHFFTSGYIVNAGAVGWIIYYEWLQATGIVYPWLARYYEPVAAGEIELETAVTDYLSELGLPLPTL